PRNQAFGGLVGLQRLRVLSVAIELVALAHLVPAAQLAAARRQEGENRQGQRETPATKGKSVHGTGRRRAQGSYPISLMEGKRRLSFAGRPWRSGPGRPSFEHDLERNGQDM